HQRKEPLLEVFLLRRGALLLQHREPPEGEEHRGLQARGGGAGRDHQAGQDFVQISAEHDQRRAIVDGPLESFIDAAVDFPARGAQLARHFGRHQRFQVDRWWRNDGFLRQILDYCLLSHAMTSKNIRAPSKGGVAACPSMPLSSDRRCSQVAFSRLTKPDDFSHSPRLNLEGTMCTTTESWTSVWPTRLDTPARKKSRGNGWVASRLST